jgi:hypothetical protein
MNEVSEVGREAGGEGMNTGTGFLQLMPREMVGAIGAAISRLLLLNRGGEKPEVG